MAAIAVPNFLEFQTRAKVSRIHSDMRSLATAIEAYIVDNNAPSLGQVDCRVAFGLNNNEANLKAYTYLTTPISYITTAPVDVFVEQGGDPAQQRKNFVYMTFEGSDESGTIGQPAEYAAYRKWICLGFAQ